MLRAITVFAQEIQFAEQKRPIYGQLCSVGWTYTIAGERASLDHCSKTKYSFL